MHWRLGARPAPKLAEFARGAPAEDMGPNPTPSTLQSLCFWLFAALSPWAAGIATITRRNL